jgi:AcrR family transcriptional regulator
MAETTTRRPRGATREAILDVSLELFIEQGYDKTSLREIADRLGVTKAALYYHFEKKEDILLELHLRLHALFRDLIDEVAALEDEREAAAAWPGLIDRFIDRVAANPELFVLHQRNEHAFRQLSANERHDAENADFEAQFRRLLSSDAIPIAARVRMACSVGALFGLLMSFNGLFGDVDAAEVAEHVRTAAREVFPGGSAPRGG